MKTTFILFLVFIPFLLFSQEFSSSVELGGKVISITLPKTLDSLSNIYRVKVKTYTIYEDRDRIIKSIDYIDPKSNQLTKKKIYDTYRYYWCGKELSYNIWRDSLHYFYLRYCDSLRVADSLSKVKGK